MRQFRTYLIVVLLMLLSVCMIACNANNQSDGDYVITVHPNNGSQNFEWKLSDDIPTIERDGYSMDGIYLDSLFMSATSFKSLQTTGITSNLDVYVKWVSHKHEFGMWFILNEPTHTEEGLRVWYCSLCNAEKYEKMQTIGDHVFSDVWTIDVPPTETTAGEKSHHCTIAGCSERKDITEMPLATHNHNYTITVVPATCMAEGYEKKQCIECFKEEINPLYIANGKTHKEFKAGEKCDVCGYVCLSNKDDSTLMFNPEQETYCAEFYGETIKATTFFAYHSKINITYIAPEVTTISDNAFMNWTTLSSIKIPDGVVSIGNNAFANCKEVEEINLPETLTHLGQNTFVGTEWYTKQNYGQIYCDNVAVGIKGSCNKIDEIKEGTRVIANEFFAKQTVLAVVTIPESVEYIGDNVFSGCDNLTSVYFNAKNVIYPNDIFKNMKSIENITFGKDVQTVNSEILSGCSSLSSLTLPHAQFRVATLFGEEKVPSTLKTVKVIGGNIANRAFDGFSTLDTVEISGDSVVIGEYAFNACNNITKIILKEGVTEIGAYAFYQCRSISEITIPNTVTKIGAAAFSQCSKLKEVEIGDSVAVVGRYAFDYCIELINIEIPDSVTIIGDNAFSNCTKLSEIGFGNSITQIGNNAFYNCSSLTEIILSDSVVEIGDDAFSACEKLSEIILGNSITRIGNRAFNGCNGLTKIKIPDSVTTIGADAFCDCTKLSKISFGNSITNIGSRAFYRCNNITEINIPDSVTEIGYYAFNNCSNLVRLSLGSGLNKISDDAFARCTRLKSISGSASMCGKVVKQANPSSYTVNITSGLAVDSNAFNNCTGLNSLSISNSVKSIGENAFNGCSELVEISLGAQLDDIDDTAFNGCTKLKSISGSASMCAIVAKQSQSAAYTVNITSGASIEKDTFRDCNGLTVVTIGNTVTSVGEYAFYNCANLATITIADSVTSIGDYATYDCSGLKSVNYTGTTSQWRQIRLGSYNAYLVNAKINYEYVLEGNV